MKLRKILASIGVAALAVTGFAAPASAQTSAGSWSLDATTEKSGVVLEVIEDGWTHFKASPSSKNGTSSDQYPSVAIHDGEYDFTKSGSFETKVKSSQDGSLNRFGFYLGYKDPAHGLFIGYDASGWFWQNYGASDETWYKGDRIAKPAANTEVQVKITWDGEKASLTVNGTKAFDPVSYENMKLSSKIAMKAGVFSDQITDVSVSDNKAKAPQAPEPSTALAMPSKDGKLEIKGTNVTAYLYKDFPQIAFYETQGKQLAGHVGDPISKVKINEVEYSVSVTPGTVDSSAKVATYKVEIKDLKADFTVQISFENDTLQWKITNINDPQAKIDRLAIPHLDLVTVDAAKSGSMTFALDTTSREVSSDTTINIAQARDGATGNGWFASINNNELAAGLISNAISDDEDAGKDGSDVKNRWQGKVSKHGKAKIGTVSPGSWVIYGKDARGEGKIGAETLPYAQVRVVGDSNDDTKVDWQDSATATREIMVSNGLPNGYEDTANNVIERIPFNIVSQATHPFLRTLDDTKRISLATDNLGQNVLLKGYQAEGHDSAQGDYGSHYNERAGGFNDLVTMLKSSRDYNAHYGVHVNATESYSEAQCFSDGQNKPAGEGANYKYPCELQMPPSAAWGWMNQSYYMNSVKDLTTKNVVNRFQNFRDELEKAKVEDELDWLYFDVYYRTGWIGRRLAEEMNKQGWRVGSEWAYSMPDYSLWSHWANDENYGGVSNKGINSPLVRFIQNSWRDTWNPDPLLGNPNTKEFEGWTGQTDYNNFINNVWQRNLPAKFLQQSDIKTYELGKKATFTNGTEVTSSRTSISGKDLGTDRTIKYGGKTVYTKGTYLLPWGKTEGVGDETAAGEKMYHYNQSAGETTWQLTGAFADTKSFTLYELTDTGRANPVQVMNADGSVTLKAKANTAYVLYPNKADTQADPKWGEGTHISDPGFYSGDLSAEGYTTTGSVSINKNFTANGGRNLGRVAEIAGGDAGSLSQKLTLPQGNYSMWAWVEIEQGKERPVSVSVSGDAKAIGNQAQVNDIPTTDITMSSAINATASDEKLRTYFQRVRVTFHTDGKGVTFKVAAGKGDARVRIDDLRVVEYKAPVDTAEIKETVFFDDFESVDTGYWPFVTGIADIGGDARTQMAEDHPPYSDAGWYGKNASGVVVEKGKLTDNVLAGKWSLLAHEENAGLILRTTQASVPFESGKTYRVSMDYQNAYAGEYELVLGRDRVTGTSIVSNDIETKPFAAARGKGVNGTGTQTMSIEFTTGTQGNYWIGINKVGGSFGSDLSIDNFRVELIDDSPEALPGNADANVTVATSPVSEGESTKVNTSVSFFESGTPTNVKTTLTGPDGWTITSADAAAATDPSKAQTWNVDVPLGASDGVVTYTVSYDVDNDGKIRKITKTANVKVVRGVRLGTNYLSDLPWTDEANGWGPVERDQSNGEQGRNDGTPIMMGDVKYTKGLGMHAVSNNQAANVTFDLTDKQCTRLRAVVGVNDTQPKGSVTFTVLADGEQIFGPTEKITKTGGTKTIDLDITGKKKIQLQVGTAGDGNGNDHANWGNARVICGTPSVSAQDTTAKTGEALSIPVTLSGFDTAMPYTVTLENAPDGLEYNVAAGTIEGSVAKPFDGEVSVKVTQGEKALLTGTFHLIVTKDETPVVPPVDPLDPEDPVDPVDPEDPAVDPAVDPEDPSEQKVPSSDQRADDRPSVVTPRLSDTGSHTLWAMLGALTLVLGGTVLTTHRRHA